MIPENRVPTHPGEILREEFLAPIGMSQTELADHLRIPLQRVNEIVKGKRGITPDTAWLFARAFRTSPEFWSNLQTQHDLAKARQSDSYTQVDVIKAMTVLREPIEKYNRKSPARRGSLKHAKLPGRTRVHSHAKAK